MLLVAIKMLVGDRIKYLALILGISFASLLITQQASIFNGFSRQMGSWIRDTAVSDLWVMDEQVEFTEDLKSMLDNQLDRVRGVDGVEWAVPIYKNYFNAIFPDGTRRNVRLVGIDDATLVGGPPVMVEGELADLRKDRAVIINADHAATSLLLKRNPGGPRPMRVGDRVSFNDHEVQVVGTYRATKEFFWEPVFYTTYSRAKYLYPDQRKPLMYVMVKVKNGFSLDQVKQSIGQIKGLKALTSSEFETMTINWIVNQTGILVNFGITIIMGMIIGLLVAGQTFYTFVLDNLKHFAALKAMGITNLRAIGMLGIQTLIVSSIGYGIGVGVASISGQVLLNAGLAFEMSWPIPVFAGLAIMVCCMAAGGLGMIRVVRLEPGIVFK